MALKISYPQNKTPRNAGVNLMHYSFYRRLQASQTLMLL